MEVGWQKGGSTDNRVATWRWGGRRAAVMTTGWQHGGGVAEGRRPVGQGVLHMQKGLTATQAKQASRAVMFDGLATMLRVGINKGKACQGTHAA